MSLSSKACLEVSSMIHVTSISSVGIFLLSLFLKSIPIPDPLVPPATTSIGEEGGVMIVLSLEGVISPVTVIVKSILFDNEAFSLFIAVIVTTKLPVRTTSYVVASNVKSPLSLILAETQTGKLVLSTTLHFVSALTS